MLRNFFFLLLVLLCGCKTNYLAVKSAKDIPFSKSKIEASWAEMEPTYSQYQEVRNIRTVVHFLDTKDSLLNVDRDFLLENINLLIHTTNDKLAKNNKMSLPVGNNTASFDSKIRLQLDSANIFYHCIENPFLIKKGSDKNLYNRTDLRRYMVRPDSFLNIFLMPYLPKQIDEGLQKFDKSGIALGTAIKMGGFIQSGEPAWDFGGLLMHELGHVLGLRHSWNTNDGCEDTPRHSNCWERTDEEPCNAPVSTNFMDYNPTQSAITPCQIAKMQANIASIGTTAHKLTEANWCNRDTSESRVIVDRQKWNRPIQITGDITIKKGGKLYVSSWLSLAEASSILLKKVVN